MRDARPLPETPLREALEALQTGTGVIRIPVTLDQLRLPEEAKAQIRAALEAQKTVEAPESDPF